MQTKKCIRECPTGLLPILQGLHLWIVYQKYQKKSALLTEKVQKKFPRIDVHSQTRRREKLIIRLKELEGRRGFAGERSELRVRISELTDSIKKADGRLFELEAAKPFKQLSQRARSQGAATKPGTAIIISSYSRLDFLTFYIIRSIISFGCQNSKPIKILRRKNENSALGSFYI